MRTTQLVTALAVAGLLVAGCSGADDAGEDTAAPAGVEAGDSAEMTEGELAPDAEEGAADDGGGESGEGGGEDVVTFGGTGEAVSGRALARTASVILEVESIEQASSRVTAAAQRAGGFVQDAQVRGGDFGSGVLTLRVPAETLDATLEDLGDIGSRVVESSITTEDLTDQLTDLQARIDNLTRLESELQALLGDVRSGDPEAADLLQVFERLNQTRGEIERLEASRAAAQERVALATINVELLPRSTAPEDVEPEAETTLGRAWDTTQDAFGAIADGAIWLVVTILPVALVLLGTPALLIWGLIRLVSSRRRDAGPSAPDAPPAPPSSPGPDAPAAATPEPSDPEPDHADPRQDSTV